jgi:hypothetical protein
MELLLVVVVVAVGRQGGRPPPPRNSTIFGTRLARTRRPEGRWTGHHGGWKVAVVAVGHSFMLAGHDEDEDDSSMTGGGGGITASTTTVGGFCAKLCRLPVFSGASVIVLDVQGRIPGSRLVVSFWPVDGMCRCRTVIMDRLDA